jgi:hypothetical protein
MHVSQESAGDPRISPIDFLFVGRIEDFGVWDLLKCGCNDLSHMYNRVPLYSVYEENIRRLN